MAARCDNCRFWDGKDSCRRYPPQVVAMKHVIWNGKETHMREMTFWPEAAAMDWCGEHQPAAGLVPPQQPET